MKEDQTDTKLTEEPITELKPDDPIANQTHPISINQPSEEKEDLSQDKKSSPKHSILNETIKSKEAKIQKTNKNSNQKSKDVLPPNYKLIQSYKLSTESEKERKQYEDRVLAMKNRLKALKKQENDLHRKMNVISNKEKELEMIKSKKENFKQALSSHKYERIRKLDDQKKKNVEEKIRVSSGVKNAINDSRIKKHADFDLARNEKQIIVSLISEHIEQLGNKNQRRINQIKSEHENLKAEEQKRQMEREQQIIKIYQDKREKEAKTTSRLKNQIVELEKLEEQYIQSLQNTRLAGMKQSSMLKSNNTQKVLKLATESLSIKRIEFDHNQKNKRTLRSKSTTTNGKERDLKKNEGNQDELTKDNSSMVKSFTNIRHPNKKVIEEKKENKDI